MIYPFVFVFLIFASGVESVASAHTDTGPRPPPFIDTIDLQGRSDTCAPQLLAPFAVVLPSTASFKFQRLAEETRRQIADNGGYAILDLRHIFTPAIGQHWYDLVSHENVAQIYQGFLLQMNGDTLISQPASSFHLQEIAQIRDWFRALFVAAVGNQIVLNRGFSNMRWPLGQEHKHLHFGPWHPDGGGASVTLAVNGIGSEVLGNAPLGWPRLDYHSVENAEWIKYFAGAHVRQVPQGHALLFFGSDAASNGLFPAAVHRSPPEKSKRALLVLRY